MEADASLVKILQGESDFYEDIMAAINSEIEKE